MNYENMVEGFGIVNGSEINQQLYDYAEKGALRGVYLGFPNIHEHYTMSIPGVTDWTGFPQSGKTEVLMEFLVFTAINYGWRHLVYFPDVGNSVEIISDIIHKISGKSFDKRYQNSITQAEIAKHTPWVLHHFKIVTKNDLKAKMTPYQFWDLAVKLKEEERNNGGLHTASIDAWKDMHHNTREFGRDDKYLEDVLSYRNAIAEKHKLHLHTIIHPLKTKEDADGKRKPPGPYDLKGGSEWYNNGKCMITVHRPENSSNLVNIHFNKIKPRSIGSVGIGDLFFSVPQRNYFINDVNDQGNVFQRYAEKDIYKLKTQKVKDVSNDDLQDPNADDELPF